MSEIARRIAELIRDNVDTFVGDERTAKWAALIDAELAAQWQPLKEAIEARAWEAFLRRKYVIRTNRGIDYLEAGVDDLAKEIARNLAPPSSPATGGEG